MYYCITDFISKANEGNFCCIIIIESEAAEGCVYGAGESAVCSGGDQPAVRGETEKMELGKVSSQLQYRCQEPGSKWGFRNWMPKIGNCKILGCLIFKGRQQFIQITAICMY